MSSPIEHHNNFVVIEGVVYEYVCGYCVETLGTGFWSKWYVDRFHNGSLEELNEAHKKAHYPYHRSKHEVTLIGEGEGA